VRHGTSVPCEFSQVVRAWLSSKEKKAVLEPPPARRKARNRYDALPGSTEALQRLSTSVLSLVPPVPNDQSFGDSSLPPEKTSSLEPVGSGVEVKLQSDGRQDQSMVTPMLPHAWLPSSASKPLMAA